MLTFRPKSSSPNDVSAEEFQYKHTIYRSDALMIRRTTKASRHEAPTRPELEMSLIYKYLDLL